MQEATPETVMQCWNEIVTAPIPQVRKLTAGRRKKLQARCAEFPSLEGWRTVIAWLNGQDWCRALGRGTHPNWTATLDFLIRSEDQVQKYLELAERTAPDEEVPLAWKWVLNRLKAQVTQAVFHTWFAPLRCLSAATGPLVVQVSDQATLDYILRHYLEELHVALQGREIRFKVQA